MDPYYYGYRVGDRNPKIKHASLQDAQRESLRLSAQHPGDTFELLMCLGVTRTTEPSTFWMNGVIPPHKCAMHRLADETCWICGKSLENTEARDRSDNATPPKPQQSNP